MLLLTLTKNTIQPRPVRNTKIYHYPVPGTVQVVSGLDAVLIILYGCLRFGRLAPCDARDGIDIGIVVAPHSSFNRINFIS